MFVSFPRRLMLALWRATAILLTDLIKELRGIIPYGQTTILLANRLVVKVPTSKKKNPYFIRAAFKLAESVRTTWGGLDKFFGKINEFLDTDIEREVFNIGGEDWTIYRNNDNIIHIELQSIWHGAHRDITTPQILYVAIQTYRDLIKRMGELDV